MGSPRQEYWSGLHFLLHRIIPTQGLNSHILHWQADSLPLSHQGSPLCYFENNQTYLGIRFMWTAAAAKSLQSCPTLCDPIDSSSPGSPVLGILQARTLEWVAISFSKAWEWKVKGKSGSCSVVSDSYDPMDYSPSGSSVRGIFQARVLEWGAIAFSIHVNERL